MRFRVAGFLVGLLIVAAIPVQAAPVSFSIGSLGYAEGQSLEGGTIGLAMLTSEVGDLHYTAMYGQGLFAGSFATSDVYLDFSAPVSNFSVTAGDGGGDEDAFQIFVYQFGTDLFLGQFASTVFGGENEPEWFTLTAGLSNVGRIVFDPGNSGVFPGSSSGAGGVVITGFGYDDAAASVPDAGSSLVLLGMGLIALRAWRKS